MGHGNRWAVVDGSAAKDAIARYIPRITDSGAVLAGRERRFLWPADEHRSGEAAVASPIGLVLHHGPFALCAISLPRPGAKALVLMTAYPTPREGILQRVVVREVEEDCLGLEGWVHAETDSGMPIDFFAADYFVHSERYDTGSVVEVSLSGLAYSVRAAVAQDVVIDDPAILRKYRDAGMEVPGSGPLRICTEGAAILLPMEGWEPFDYTFQGPMKDRSRVVHEGCGFNYLTTTVARVDGDEVDMIVLAADHVLDGELPNIGDDVGGSMCLMGQMADFRWPDGIMKGSAS